MAGHSPAVNRQRLDGQDADKGEHLHAAPHAQHDRANRQQAARLQPGDAQQVDRALREDDRHVAVVMDRVVVGDQQEEQQGQALLAQGARVQRADQGDEAA